VIILATSINGQTQTEAGEKLRDSGILTIKPPKSSYQLNSEQIIQNPKFQKLINNEEPYSHETIQAPTQNRHSVIFEPIRHIQFSRSVYRMTSLINFNPHIEFFEAYEMLLKEFLADMVSKGVSDMISKPHKVGDGGGLHGLPDELRDVNCSDSTICENNDHIACYQWFLSICMNQRHYGKMLDDVEYVE